MLGLGGISWDQLKDIAGIRRPQERIRFKGQEQKQSTGAGRWTREKEELWGLLCQMTYGDEDEAMNVLFRMTENKEKGFRGIRDPQQLTDNQVRYLLPRVRKEYEKTVPPEDGPPEVGSDG